MLSGLKSPHPRLPGEILISFQAILWDTGLSFSQKHDSFPALVSHSSFVSLYYSAWQGVLRCFALVLIADHCVLFPGRVQQGSL